jgi:polyferredoxin
MRAAGLFVALVGVAGIILGLMAMFGVHFLQPSAGLGDVRMPGAGPIIAGVIMLAAGLAIATSRAKA